MPQSTDLLWWCINLNNIKTNQITYMNESAGTYVIAISFISALGGYLFGFDFAVISGALPFLQKQFLLDAYWEGFATGCLALGAIIGCLIAGKVSDHYGRKPGLLIAAAIFAISALAMAFSPSRN